MATEDIRILKAKCNKLIEKALCLKEEIERKNLEIEKLEEQKRALEMAASEIPPNNQNVRHIEEEKEEILETGEENMNLPVVVEESKVSRFTQQQILEMIYQVQNQEPRDEIVVRNLTTKAKIIEVVTDTVSSIFKFLLMAVIMILLSIAATVLLNEELRNTILAFIERCM